MKHVAIAVVRRGQHTMRLILSFRFNVAYLVFRQRNKLHVSDATPGDFSRGLWPKQQFAVLPQTNGPKEYFLGVSIIGPFVVPLQWRGIVVEANPGCGRRF